jgi:hypothetical protein
MNNLEIVYAILYTNIENVNVLDTRPVGIIITVRNLTLLVLICSTNQFSQNVPLSLRHLIIMLRLLCMEVPVMFAAFISCSSRLKRGPICVL